MCLAQMAVHAKCSGCMVGFAIRIVLSLVIPTDDHLRVHVVTGTITVFEV